MKGIALALGLLCASFSIHATAQEYMFTYSKLYSSLKNNNKPEYPDVKVGVFFLNADTKQLCSIEKAWMEKEEHYELLESSPNNELLLPLDDNLKQANPLVFVDTPKDLRCDFSLVVMTRESLTGKVTYNDIEKLLPQMQDILESLGGMFSSWFTPEVAGVTLEFANNLSGVVSLSNGNSVQIVNGKAQVTLDEIGKEGWITLPEKTIRVLPYLPTAKK
ncbi:DUF2987 domain-containing protein [Vibrio ziniensis]|uniref:DUF2987 domain-containing protein n=1 Tax=Vibrio ziniensis TaxID=2711221 RepID=A0A6G7CI79_9VIBR|nr:DUF2987 domain-containing protein [Vibrio ziniensis]QIH41784.1 DUF2987 domain-containing protein [Vibrio ziniensis]